MKMEAAEMRDNMGIEDKVRGGNRRWTIEAADMRYNGDIREGDKGKFRRRQRRRRGTGNRRDAGKPEIEVFGRRLRWAQMHREKRMEQISILIQGRQQSE